MAIAGPELHQQLIHAYGQAQARLESQRAQISQAQITRDGLNQDRSDALVSLAEHYLPELTREAIEKTWGEVQPAFSQLLLRKEDHRRRLQTKLDQLTDDQSRQSEKLVRINERLAEAIGEQDQVASEVQQRLQADEEFVLLSDRAAVAEAALERAEANLQEIDQDAARKLPAYEKSSLFRYLYDRGFGTSSYTKRGFTRRMDRTLAKFIDFTKAKHGYEFLKRTPDQMRKIIAEDRVALDTVMDELERRRDTVADQLGLPARIDAANTVAGERNDLLESLDHLRDAIENTQTELAQLEDSRGQYYREAIDSFRELLEKHGQSDLERRAQETPEVTDDQIVARLMGVEMEKEELSEAVQRHRDDLQGYQDELAALGRVVQRFRAAQFDSPRSHFVGSLNLHEEIERARESGDIGQIWKRIRRAQRWGPARDPVPNVPSTQPMAQVLTGAMADAATSDMQNHARRAANRRTKTRSENRS